MGKIFKRKKYYAVKNGKKPGIYSTWEECKEQVNKFHNAKFKGFETYSEAENYLKEGVNYTFDKNKEEIEQSEKKFKPILKIYELKYYFTSEEEYINSRKFISKKNDNQNIKSNGEIKQINKNKSSKDMKSY